MQEIYQKIRVNPKYQRLLAQRNSFAYILAVGMIIAYYGFILLVAFNKELLAQKLGTGVMSLGVPIGLGVILFTIAVTTLYVRRANSEYDQITAEIIEEANK